VIVAHFENKQTKVIVVRVSVQSTYAPDAAATGFELRFQAPIETSNASCELLPSVTDNQSGDYDVKNGQVVWKMSNFPGLGEFSARFKLMKDPSPGSD
jgi:hypothetical protein